MKAVRCLAILLILAGCAPLPKYTVTPVAGPGSAAFGINNLGHTVGRIEVSGGAEHAFLNDGGIPLDLGTFGGPNSRAWGINDSGVVVGEAESAPGVRRAFTYSGGPLNDLGTLGGAEAAARAINNNGEITGFAALPDNTSRAFRYSGGVMQNLGTLPSSIELYSFGYAINRYGKVAGSSSAGAFSPPEPPQHAFVTFGSSLIDIGTFGGQFSAGYGINDHGTVVGTAATDVFRRNNAFVYWKGFLFNIGTLGGGYAEAFDINNGNLVVGTSGGSVPSRGFIWSKKSGMVALDTLIDPSSPGWTITDARAINENKQIAGTGCKGGVCQAVRLDPVP